MDLTIITVCENNKGFKVAQRQYDADRSWRVRQVEFD